MSRRNARKDNIELAEQGVTLAVIILISLWFYNKSAFWFWLIIILGILGIILWIAIAKRKARIHKNSQWRTDNDLIYWLRGLKPWEFEDYITELFRKLGYETEKVGQVGDHGIDVIIKKNGQTSYIQCKKFITSTVSEGEIRDFYGAIVDKLVNGKAYFVTTNKFTLAAEKFAEDKPIELVDRYKLVKYIRMSESQKK